MGPEVGISIDVPDMERAVSFYTGALGFETTRSGEDTTVLSTGSMPIYLLKRQEGTNPLLAGTAARAYHRHWTPVHLDVTVDDLAAAVARVKEAGGTCEGEEAADWGGIAYCADPFGHGFCLIRVERT